MQPGLKKLTIIFIVPFLLFPGSLSGQKQKAYDLLHEFIELYKKGDFVGAKDCVMNVVKIKDSIPPDYLARAYIDLGVIYQFTGRYDDALENYSLAERLFSLDAIDPNLLAFIYINKAIIYDYQKSIQQAIEYYEKGIRNFLTMPDTVSEKYLNLSKAYMNIGISLLEAGDYKPALSYLYKSEELKKNYDLPGLELVQLNFGNAYAKTKDSLNADMYFKKSINTCIKQNGMNFFRLGDIYKDYSIFLNSVNRNKESLKALQNALSVYLKNYRIKHPQVSRTYNLIGDHYRKLHDYESALVYYQKSLISIVDNFDDPDFLSNPPIDSSLLDIRLLAGLKSKAQCLELLSARQADPASRLRFLNKSMETIGLVIRLIDRIRNNYPTEDSKLYLAENEKETYIFATHIANTLMSDWPDVFQPEQVYRIAAKAKAAILRNEISENELLRSGEVPDSVKELRISLAENIAAYNYLVIKESQASAPDYDKIDKWKDELFYMNRKNEELTNAINKAFPEYQQLILMTEPDSIPFIQERLSEDETIIDYLISNRNNDGKRKLFTFIITRKSLKCFESVLDPSFELKADIIRIGDKPASAGGDRKMDFILYTDALHYMYEKLIKPFEGHFAGNKLIIIPDEEIAWISFDALLPGKPEEWQTDYEGLNFLINKYVFSYGYSSSLVFGRNRTDKNNHQVYSFSPDYNREGVTYFRELKGARTEINSIYRYFNGKKFTGQKASKERFRDAAENSVIFHLAMHALPDSSNPKYSFFLFDSDGAPQDEGKLYNYEISLMRSNSPMVVLSACNSGTGKLNQGEGLMSLARGFILAGASSVIKTGWEVNDEVSAAIISDFYRFLSRGKQKDDAMRLAKLKFLKNSIPAHHNPYYWAAYEVMGDNAPVARSSRSIVLVSVILILIVAGILIFYSRWRSIFSERLL